MKDEFYLYLDTLPRTTSQEKGVFVVKGRPIFYEKEEVKKARRIFTHALKPHRPQIPSDRPIKLYVQFYFDVKDKKKWKKYKITKPDTDNYLKLFKDCMTDCGFWLDDAQVVDERCRKTYAEKAVIRVVWQELKDTPLEEEPT